MLGSLLDVVDIDAGFEAAFEAAAGDALAAVVVEGPDVARRAISALLDGDAAGAVLPLPDEPTSSVPMTGLRAHVRGTRPGVDALLDRLVGATALVDAWPEALDVSGADPAAAVVTRAGDRFGPTGWRVGAVGAGATGAALTEARAQAELATVAAARAEQQVAAARQAVDGSRRVETEAQRSVDANDAAVHALVDAVARVEAEKGEGGAEADTLRAHLADLEHRVAGEADRLAELEAALPGLEAAEADAAAQSRAVAEARSRLEEQAATVGSRRRDLELRSAGLAERRQFLDRRRAEVEERLSNHVAERRSAEARRVELDQRALATDRLSALVASRLAVVEAEVASLRERRRRQSEAAREVAAGLDALRRRRSAAEQALMEGRERLQRAELTETETTLRIEAAVEALRRDLDTEPEAAMAATLPEGFDHPSPVGRVRELERELRLMGPINPLALEEHTALVERHDFLSGQLEDVKSSRRDLGRVIRSIDAEIVNVFAAAYADVAVNFERLFETLFPGGKGSLRLTNPEDLLGTGIELEAKPSGKNVKKLSLLSGGERSLTALAYLFAVFRARPSPFYVMDEVEAALDDVNLHRFLELVHEFRSEAQLIIVTHQKRTMEAADCLYGVTMAPGGSSQVVSERVTSPIG